MDFRSEEEILVENLGAPINEIWYQDTKEIPFIQLPERALVAVKMSLLWKADRRDKPVYVQDKTNVALYVVAYQREKRKMTTVQLDVGEKPWYHQIVRNFALPKDVDLEAQPAGDVGVGPESKKKKRVPAATTAPKKTDIPKVDVLKVEKKKGTRLVSDSWCDYTVVSDSLERLAPVAVKKPNKEPKDTADLPESNPDDPIDLESSPEPLFRTKVEKRKKPEGGAAAQLAKKLARKKIGKKGNLDAFAANISPSEFVFLRFPPLLYNKVTLQSFMQKKLVASSYAKSLFSFDDRVPSLHLELPKEKLEGEKTVEVEVETTDVGVTKPFSPAVVMPAQEPEKNKSVIEDEPPVVTAHPPLRLLPSFSKITFKVLHKTSNIRPLLFMIRKKNLLSARMRLRGTTIKEPTQKSGLLTFMRLCGS
ncbi:hypothetical protein HanPI659440_Chr13g0517381 [Helianthus annuus]|nr:hypothetical protein HanPI659440_Chr13g0517381 [Helianthus annuus]